MILGMIPRIRRLIVPSLCIAAVAVPLLASQHGQQAGHRPHLTTRGTYGVMPTEIFEAGRTLADYGINTVFLNAGLVNAERVAKLRSEGVRIYAEYNTMHYAEYLKAHPDAAPIGTDGKVSPPPEGWQGICPTHPGYRANRMAAFRELLEALRDRRGLARLPPRPCELGTGGTGDARHLLLPAVPAAVLARDRDAAAGCAHPRRGRAAARRASPHVGAVAMRRVHRLGARVPGDHPTACGRAPSSAPFTTRGPTPTSTAPV
jgi:hypothetical protein